MTCWRPQGPPTKAGRPGLVQVVMPFCNTHVKRRAGADAVPGHLRRSHCAARAQAAIRINERLVECAHSCCTCAEPVFCFKCCKVATCIDKTNCKTLVMSSRINPNIPRIVCWKSLSKLLAKVLGDGLVSTVYRPAAASKFLAYSTIITRKRKHF